MSRGIIVFTYRKLWALMKEKNITKSDLRNKGILSSATIAKLGKNDKVSMDVLEVLCDYLECQPGDIVEYIPDKDIQELEAQVDALQSLIGQLKIKGNFSDEDISKIASALNEGRSVLELQDVLNPVETEE